MTKYILHGGYTRHENELNYSFFREFASDLPDGANVLLVFFAAKEEKVDEAFQAFAEKFKKHSGGKELNFVNAAIDEFVEQLKEADAIYFQGGETDKLKAALTKFPDFQDLLDGKTVAGSSAGAYVLSSYYYTGSKDKVLEGFGVIPVRVVCHYESPEHPAPENYDPVGRLEGYGKDLELVLLRDCEWKVFNL